MTPALHFIAIDLLRIVIKTRTNKYLYCNTPKLKRFRFRYTVIPRYSQILYSQFSSQYSQHTAQVPTYPIQLILSSL